jgi:amino acid transporter/nucleotide-binding universal stress UspA family protein
MVKDILSRDLGLFSIIAISTGAMVGAGIFILPGLAAQLAGPAVIIAFIAAGLITLTAALSVSELATAMPASGGAYVFISRSMGPFMGSVAGWGVWISLILKGSFALVGLSAYLSLIVSVPISIKYISLALCIFLLILNGLGARATGRFQSLIITIVLALLIIFIVLGLPQVNTNYYEPFTPMGFEGVLAAAGLVFVSYIGVTQIASVAEEIEEPEKNIPRGILISLGLMMIIYAFVVFVIVGTVPLNDLETSYTPIASAGEFFMGQTGLVIIAVIAVIALISMANAAILTTTRYPFAMSRDQLMPNWLLKINPRFSTPHNSIILTGIIMLVLIAFIDVVNLAKLASVFTILTFTLIHFALIIFRLTMPEGYNPSFKSPLFPTVQIIGITASFILITQMGLLPIAASIILFLFGIGWFYFYGVERVSFKGAFQEALVLAKEQKIKHKESSSMEPKKIKILIPLNKLQHEGDLMELASWMTKKRKLAVVQVVQIKEVPIQTPFEVVKGLIKGAETKFEQRTLKYAEKLGMNVETYEILSHDWKHSVVNFAKNNDSDLILLDWEEEFHHELIHGSDVHWILENSPCDVTIFKDRGIEKIRDILLTTTSDVYDNLKVRMANNIGHAKNATITFLQFVDPHMGILQKRTMNKYHDMLKKGCFNVCRSEIIESKHLDKEIIKEAKVHDMIIISATEHQKIKGTIFGYIEDKVITKVDCSVLITKHVRKKKKKGTKKAS